ncbi:TonB-dependent receptor [Sphingomonas jatrophae]|uniref:TonB-dependent Receptor Plug Domain n=1 Tax=Sphingomonas jatrophae TaxID=1166337 RepID=A0A1I6JFP1_9SPHN|nr:TonB-dependent receptor [Sphingomonas jatrophae]SFR77772.1 TonB-dependent Receptor Plug Domain [Sphingomonas jatrophae]
MPIRTSLFALAFILAGEPALAQVTRPAFRDVIVTARRRAEMQAQVPLSIDSYDAESVNRLDIRTLEDLRYTSPSLYIAPSLFRQDTINITIRGQQNFPSTGLQFDTSTAVYVDGVYQARPVGLTGTLFDVARVEVLKGPQGTLIGRNSTGGAILYETRAPEAEIGGYARATLGDYGRRELQGALNLPLSPTLALRVAGAFARQTGYLRNLYADPVSGARNDTPSMGLRRYAGQAALKWSPDPDFTLLLRAKENEEDYTGVSYHTLGYFVGSVNAAGNRPSICNIPGTCTGFTDLLGRQITPYFADFPQGRTVSTAPTAYNALLSSVDRAARAGFWTTEQAISNRNKGRYSTLSAEATGRIGGTEARLLVARRNFATRGSSQNRGLPYVTNVFLYETPRYRSSQAELTLNGKLAGDRVDWTAGLFGFRETSPNDGDQLYLFLPSGISPAPVAGRQITYTDATRNDARNTSYAAYAQATWRVRPDTRLTAGARYTIDRRFARLQTRTQRFPASPATNATVRGGIFDPATYTLFGIAYPGITNACALTDTGGRLLPLDQCSAEVRRTFRKPTFTLALDHDLADRTLAYVTARTGYRSGAINSAAINPAVITARPERVLDVELGLKSDFELAGVPLRTTIAGYWTRYRDIQIQATLPNVTLATGPGGSACTQGVFDGGQCLGATNDAVTLNARAARVRGLEWTLAARPARGLTLETGGSFLDARYTDYSFEPPAGYLRPTGSVNLSGTRFPLPKWQLSGSAVYRTGPVELSWRTYWQSLFEADLRAFNPAQRTSAYPLSNARVALTDVAGSKVELAAFVNNVFGKKACVPEPQGVLNSAPNGTFGVAGTSGVLQCLPLSPRMWGGQIGFRF